MSIHATRGWRPVVLLTVLCAGFEFWGCADRRSPRAGAVVESCDRAEAGDVAGLQPGDVVVAWRQADDGGIIESPFHLSMVEQERAPYGPVELTLRRGWRDHRVVVPTDRWRIHLRPVLNEASLVRHLQAREVSDTGDIEHAVGHWRVLAAESAGQGHVLNAAWFRIQAGAALATTSGRDEAVAELQAGADLIPDQRVRAAYWEHAGNELLAAGQRQVAAFAFNSVIEILETETPESPAVAFALLQLCRCDLRSCDSKATSALEIYRKMGTTCFEFAAALSTMGAVAYFRSDLDGAEERYQEALDVVRGVADGSPAECELLGNLGLVAMRRGDFDMARTLFRQDMEVAEQLGHDTPQFSHAANYLGLLAKNMGRYEEARLYYEKALEAFRATRPAGVEVAGVLTNLANLALMEGNLDAARRNHEEALVLRQGLDPESSDVAASLHNVGMVARWQGDLEIARQSLEKALVLKTRFSPGSEWTANTLFELGETARADGRLEEAESYHLKALEIFQRISPRNPRTSKSLHAVGVLDLAGGRTGSAEERWRDAIAIIEEHRLGMQVSAEERSQFGARYYTYYGSLARLLVGDGREDEAWNLLERARAGALREAVDRRGAAPADIPSELWFAKNTIERQIARIEGRIERIDPTADERVLYQYRGQLDVAEAQLGAVIEEIRVAAPRYSSFSAPGALTYRDTLESLDPGTVVISYSVGEEQSMALVVPSGAVGGREVQAFSIPMGALELSRRLNIFHSLISRGREVNEVEPALVAQARKLFSVLVGPVFKVVSAGERVLIIPDGPLVDLPFAALVLPGEGTEYFGHWKPLFFSSSASVFAEIKKLRGNEPGAEITVVAFGDPDYSHRAPVADLYGLNPLPGSREEVESIERLLGDRATTYLGVAATEDNFKRIGGGAKVIHCAVHARADSRFPMESALFFSLPKDPGLGLEDGVLRAWEVVDEMDINAEMVVLSACNTARGRAVEGEGVFGLARAFQYVGVRTLVASQWEIPDRSTADLMERFYSGLEGGLGAAEALQVAQVGVAESTLATTHPFHWASFQVRGDWR